MFKRKRASKIGALCAVLVALSSVPGWGAAWQFLDGFEKPCGIDPAAVTPDWAFSDGFEGMTAGNLPSSGDLDPNASIWNMVDFWEQSDTTLIQVGNNAGIARSGSNYLSIKKYSNASRGWYFLERWWDGNLDNSYPQHNISACAENFVWRVSVRVADAQNGIRLYVGSHSGYPSLNCQQALGVGIAGGYLTRFYLDNAVSTGQIILPNTWYDIKVAANWATQTFDLYLNNSLVGNYAFNNNWTGSVIRSMHIIADSDGALLDDISFGNGSSGQGTTCGTDADPDPNTWNATGVWETMTGDQTSIQVYDNQSGAYAGNHCVHLKPYVILERYWGWAPMEYPSIANENFTFEFAFKVGNPLYGIGFAGLGRRNDQNSYNTQQGVGVGVQGNELCVYYYTPGQPHNLSNLPTFGFASVPVLANTWYHVRMVTSVDPCQMSMPSFDLYVNHQLVATGLPWNQYSYAFGDPVGLNSVQLLNHESDSAGGVSFDNIRLLPGEGLCDPDSSTYATDINRDCHVDILDLKELVSKWLWCTRPEDGNCSVL